MKDYARGFYASTAWKKTQAAYMSSQHYLCERCGNMARIVHHRKYITEANIIDPWVTLDWDNLEALCMDCHNKEHGAVFSPDNGISFDEHGNVIKRSNVFLVCGSPGSGKSWYVSKHKNEHDLVVDMDYICAALMGEPGALYMDVEAVLGMALEVRALLYKLIASRRGKWRRAWVITSVASADEQRAIAHELNGEVIMIDTPLPVCLERIQNDARRADVVIKYQQLARRWWAEREQNASAPRSEVGNRGGSTPGAGVHKTPPKV